MASAMLYALVVTLLLAAAAWLLEKGASRIGWPTRWGWVVAMLGWATVTATGILRGPPEETPAPAVGATEIAGAGGALGDLFGTLATPPVSFPELDRWLLAGWAVLALTFCLVLLRVAHRFRELRRSWSAAVVEGYGPALAGFLRPSIVLPRWALSAPAEDRELMIVHEEEHLRAGDGRLLALKLLLSALFPWNLPLWWISRRLGLAVEVDCDRRVLRRGTGVRRYAGLLVEIGARRSTSVALAPAFSRPAPFLERRISAMVDAASPSVPRALGFATLAILVVAGACRLDAPATTGPDPANLVEVSPSLDAAPESPLAPTLRFQVVPDRGWGVLSGTVLNRMTGEPLAGVQIVVQPADQGALTNTDGRFLVLRIPSGDHSVTFTHPELGTATARIVWADAEELELSGGVERPERASPTGQLPAPPASANTGVIVGTVVEAGTGAGVASAQVSILSPRIGALTNLEGRFLLLHVPPGTHTLRVEREGFQPLEIVVEVTAGGRTQLETALRR